MPRAFGESVERVVHVEVLPGRSAAHVSRVDARLEPFLCACVCVCVCVCAYVSRVNARLGPFLCVRVCVCVWGGGGGWFVCACVCEDGLCASACGWGVVCVCVCVKTVCV